MGSESAEVRQAIEPVPLAIVGLAFELPGGVTSEAVFWQMLYEGRCTSTDFPRDRLNVDAFYHPGESRPSSIPLRGGHFLEEDLAVFDAPFFSITPAEARCMDPQHRRMLETSYHALEDAGIPINKISGSDTSVYTGCFTNDYQSILQQDYEAEQKHAVMGIAPSMLANRISWFFNLKGTSMNLDSACSSSLLALHLACQDLRAGSTSTALVGGANLVYHPHFMKFMTDFNFLSRESRCWSFDQRANGYARGEGIAMLVVKRLPDAIQDGDTIRAVIRNTGSNQDGRTPGITQPSGEAQISLIETTFKDAGDLDKSPTRFFEAHGTGTPIGDPVEANAIGTAFRDYRSPDDPLYVGAVKANVGHLEGCSGLAGVIKTILVLEKGLIPPIAGFTSRNPRINASNAHLKFPTAPTPWTKCPVRRACVNSFGFGGTNALVILDDAFNYLRLNGLHGHHRTQQNECHKLPTSHNMAANLVANDELLPQTRQTPRPKLLVWSAHDEASALRLSQAYRGLILNQEINLDDMAYHLSRRRSDLSWRAFSVVAQSAVSTVQDSTIGPPARTRNNAGIGMIFTGQGAQYANMGYELLQYPVFRESLHQSECDLKQFGCQWSIFDVLYCSNQSLCNGKGQNTEIKDLISSPEYAQPLTTCLQIAIVDLLKSFAVSPSVVLGHSSGEIAAAYTVGTLSRAEAVEIAYRRGILSSRLADESSDLGMMAVGLSEAQTLDYLRRWSQSTETVEVSIGCVNSPKNVTLTGNSMQLAALEEWLQQDGVFTRTLQVPVAYHSPFMNRIADEYTASILRDRKSSNSVQVAPMVSSVTGDVVTPERLADPHYWAQNLTSPVKFSHAMLRVLSGSGRAPRKKLGKPMNATHDPRITHLLEIGPHSALKGPIRECLQVAPNTQNATYVPSLVRNQDAAMTLLHVMGSLYVQGYPINLNAVNSLEKSPMRPVPRNMPRYPFNHSKRYWQEGRLSENFRFRQVPRHDLIGTRSLDWNPQMAQWRNVIRVAEVPWIADHKVGDEVIFPAAGMVIMAIEGLRELIGPSSSTSLRGFQLSDVAFSHPIMFPKTEDKVDVQLTISTSQIPTKDSGWSHFRLFVWENGRYNECSSGSIRAISREGRTHEVMWRALRESSKSKWHIKAPDWIEEASKACHHTIQEPYKSTAGDGSGLWYGPAFQNIELMRTSSEGEAVAEINTESWKLVQPSKTEILPPYIVHPTTLDGLAQLVLPALERVRANLPPMVPVRAANIWIDCVDERLRHGKLSAATRCRIRAHGGCADVAATTPESPIPLIYLDGLETAFIGSAEESATNIDKATRTLCTHPVWLPDLEMMDATQIEMHCLRQRPAQADSAVETYHSLIAVIMFFIDQALGWASQSQAGTVSLHFINYVRWMKYQQQRLHEGKIPVPERRVRALLDDTNAREQLIQELRECAEGRFFMEISSNIIPILSGDVDPLEIMFRDQLSEQYYSEVLANDSHSYPLMEFVGLLSFKNPSMNILEVGAGTGGQTLRLLESMSQGDMKRWAQYDYTDISPDFFENARTKFSAYRDYMRFKVFDVSRDPVAQSFAAGSYDLVVASHVLHAVTNLKEALCNLHKLLKPGGKLLLLETTQPDAVHVGFAFGLLKGWWRPVDEDPCRGEYSPCLTVEQWHQSLLQAGFSGVEVAFPGQEKQECRYTDIIISTAVGAGIEGLAHSARPTQEIAIAVDQKIESQRTAAETMRHQFDQPSNICRTTSLAELAGSPNTAQENSSLCIFLLELDNVFLDGVSESEYKHLQNVLIQWPQVLWVTRGKRRDPRHSLAEGLGRALMSEDSSRKFITLRVDDEDDDFRQRDLQALLHTIRALAGRLIESTMENLETNYRLRNGVLHIMRVTESPGLNREIAQSQLPYQVQDCRLDGRTRLSLRQQSLDHSGPEASTFEWIEDESVNDQDRCPDLSDDEIIIQGRAVGINQRDHLVSRGVLDEPTLRFDYAGVVSNAGATSGASQGDRVCLIACPTISSTARAKRGSFVRIPRHLSFVDAASMCTAILMAYHCLVNVARLRKGENILIHGASSCVGQMSIHMARTLGAHVWVTAQSASQRSVLHDQLGVPQTHILTPSEGHASFAHQLSDDLHGVQVDVVLALFTDAGQSVEDFAVALTPFGRLIDASLGLPGSIGQTATIPSNRNLPSNISRSSVDMAELLRQKPLMAHEIFQEAAKIAFEGGHHPPQPIHVFGAEASNEAFRHFLVPDVSGKRVIELRPEASVAAYLAMKPKFEFSAEATYVIAGGFGGLGRSIARWMTSRGARNLALLSRNGAQTGIARDLVAELEDKGVCVAAPRADIADEQQLKVAIATLSNMPPIRGCIQATMVLRDSMFENMSYEDWTAATRPKVAGSWNLHTLLPPDLDFFVMLSSVNGIFGGRAQANYASGNTFQDELAWYRVARGQRAVSVDLGMMVTEGVVAENKDLLASMRRIGHLMDIGKDDLMALLDYCCDPKVSLVTEDHERGSAQVIVGIEMPSAILAKGIDLHHSICRPMFRHLFRIGTHESRTGETGPEVSLDKAAQLQDASDEEAARLVKGWLLSKIASILGLLDSDIDPGKPVHTYGIDSLVAVDLRNWFAREIGADIGVFMLMGNTPLEGVSAAASNKSQYRQGKSGPRI